MTIGPKLEHFFLAVKRIQYGPHGTGFAADVTPGIAGTNTRLQILLSRESVRNGEISIMFP